MERRNPDEERMNKGSGGSSLLAGLMIGGLIGAGTMLLLAPQAGRRTREEIQQGALELKDRTTDRVRETASQVRSRAEQVASDVKNKADDLQNQGRDIAIDQLDRVASAAQSRKKTLQESRDDNSEA
jgi:gas vesicle protein